MSRPASRFVMKLTKRQIEELEQLKHKGPTPRIRQRAHAILLSHQRHSIGQIARIFGTNRITIGQWLDRWDAEKFDGLADKPRPGAPPKLSETEQERLLELLKQTPHNPVAVLSQMKQETGKEISRSTLKRIARQAGLIWKRMRKSLGSKRDQKKFAAQA